MNEQKHHAIKTWQLTFVALALSISALVASNAYRFSALHSNDIATPSITVSGEGDASALPDIATIHFTLSSVSMSVKDAQNGVETTLKKVNEGLKALGVDTKDIKTDDYNVNAKYSYPQVICMTANCPVSSPKLDGYEVSESISVTVRKIDTAGDVLALLGKNEVKNIQGPDFSVEHNDALLKSAREMAIQKAQTKAKETAKALGVTLGELKSYNEGGSSPYPVMYKAMSSLDGASAGNVELAPGESKVKVTVNLVYSLK